MSFLLIRASPIARPLPARQDRSAKTVTLLFPSCCAPMIVKDRQDVSEGAATICRGPGRGASGRPQRIPISPRLQSDLGQKVAGGEICRGAFKRIGVERAICPYP